MIVPTASQPLPGQTRTVLMAIDLAVAAGVMDGAWPCVLIMMTISVSGIIAINLWQKHCR